jgi:hypothetical protein
MAEHTTLLGELTEEHGGVEAIEDIPHDNLDGRMCSLPFSPVGRTFLRNAQRKTMKVL